MSRGAELVSCNYSHSVTQRPVGYLTLHSHQGVWPALLESEATRGTLLPTICLTQQTALSATALCHHPEHFLPHWCLSEPGQGTCAWVNGRETGSSSFDTSPGASTSCGWGSGRPPCVPAERCLLHPTDVHPCVGTRSPPQL